MAKLIEAADKISHVDDPTQFLEISYNHLVKKIKKKTKEMEICSFKKCFRVIKKDGIAKQSTTSVQNDDLAQKVYWVLHSKEDADINFIEDKLNTVPVGIVIEIDDEFESLREGIYKVRPGKPNKKGVIRKHALMIVGRGRTPNGRSFLITQNSWDKAWGVKGYGRIAIEDDYRCFVCLSRIGLKDLSKRLV